MRPLLLIAALLASSAATAQVQLTYPNTVSTTDTLRFGKSRCTDSSSVVSVTWTRSFQACSSLNVYVTAENACTDAPGSADYAVMEVPQTTFQGNQTGTVSVNLSRLPFGSGVSCDTLSDERTYRICATTTNRDNSGLCGSTTYKASALKLVFDGKPPDAPTISSASGLDEAVSVNVATPTDATEVRVVVLRETVIVAESRQPVGGSIRVEGLTNDTTYQVRAYAYDQAGNESAPSASLDVTPVKTQGFLELYEGGQGTVGCAAAGGGMVGGAVLAVLGFWLFSRRNRSWFEQ